MAKSVLCAGLSIFFGMDFVYYGIVLGRHDWPTVLSALFCSLLAELTIFFWPSSNVR